MKVRRAIYKDDDGCYIYSTTDIALSYPYPEACFVQKYVNDYGEYFIEDNINEGELYKLFAWTHIDEKYQAIKIDSEVDERIVNMEFIPSYFLVDESKFYVDVKGIKQRRKEEQDSISLASEIASKGFN